jgi:hypothetical protein
LPVWRSGIGIVFARCDGTTSSSQSGLPTMKLWLLACGAIAVVAVRAMYTLTNRESRRNTRFTGDQVSSEWLATAKIHEDHP